ncbi:unnamed protein product [Ixodes pacificus]
MGGRFLRPWVEGETGNSCSRVLKFYKEIEAAIEFFNARFSEEYLKKVKRKTLYWDTLDLLTPPPLYRVVDGSNVESDVFQRLRRYPVKTSTKNIFARFHFEVLPVKTWRIKKGFYEPWSTNCVLCPTPETLQHVFLYCTNAELFWAELRAVLRIDLYVDWKGAKFLKFGEGSESRTWEVLALLGLHAIWRSRTDHLEVAEGGKAAWQHFVDGFKYVCSLTEVTEQPGLECWSQLNARLQKRELTSRSEH